MTRERKLFIVRERPRRYPQTPQQERFKLASKACGIRRGMSREELIKAMMECLPNYFKKQGKAKGGFRLKAD